MCKLLAHGKSLSLGKKVGVRFKVGLDQLGLLGLSPVVFRMDDNSVVKCYSFSLNVGVVEYLDIL
jgi:hypothetical protein